MSRKPAGPLRRGWTTGACATAATKAALAALLTGRFPDPVEITLPKGERPSFPLARTELNSGGAIAGIVKDAGDDPDVTHGALILAEVRFGPAGSGILFRAGEGVGMVTKPGLRLAVGEPAINPAYRLSELEFAQTPLSKDTAEQLIGIGEHGGVECPGSVVDVRAGRRVVQHAH